jgi:hypothetical protein
VLGLTHTAPALKGLRRTRVDGDGAGGAAGLRWAVAHVALAGVGLEVAAHGEAAGSQVDVGPGQAEGLAAAQARGEEQPPQGDVAGAAGGGDGASKKTEKTFFILGSEYDSVFKIFGNKNVTRSLFFRIIFLNLKLHFFSKLHIPFSLYAKLFTEMKILH